MKRVGCKQCLLVLFLSMALSACSIAKYGYNYLQEYLPRYASTHRVKLPKGDGAKLKVVSYNIKYGEKIDEAIKLLGKEHDLNEADIIVLQEMKSDGVERIAKELHYNYVYYPASHHPIAKGEFGNAILSKWPITSDRKIILTNLRPGKLQRIAVEATLLVKETEVTVYSIHMDAFLNAQKRNRQIKDFLKEMPESEHLILAGDFNTFNLANQMAIALPLYSADFDLASKSVGWTYKQWFFFFRKHRLDHVFTKGMRVLNAGKVDDTTASDHMPIWVELQLKTSQTQTAISRL